MELPFQGFHSFPTKMASQEEEQLLSQKLQDLQKQLGKKHLFEEAVSSLRILLHHHYPNASPSLQSTIYSVVCRVATILQTRYTSSGFWHAGLKLFEETDHLVTKSSEKEHMKKCIARAHEHLHETENQAEVPSSARNNTRSRFLFEGHLTVEPEPPPPAWLVVQNLLASLPERHGLNANGAESSEGHGQNDNTSESGMRDASRELFQELVNNIQELDGFRDLHSAIEASLQEGGARHQKPPPASKEVVAKLPIVVITGEVIARLGSGTQCAVCREQMVINDKMQELPCTHLFHPDCLKPWLDQHNSCPICRHELQTDDHAYESRKELEKEAEEERKGAANALRGGEYMYV